MIEQIMYFGIGFLAAALIGLLIIPLVHNRAVRLTTRRLEAATPFSMAEIQADKDQLRAEFAMSMRRLEMSVEQMKAKTTSQLAEIGRKTDAINKLKTELSEKTAAILAIEAREGALREQLRTTEEGFSLKAGLSQSPERGLVGKQAGLANFAVRGGSVSNESHRLEVAALQAQVEALKAQVAGFEQEVKENEGRLTHERNEAAKAGRELDIERSRTESLGNRATELERDLATQKTEAEILGRRAQELEAQLSEQGRLLAVRESEVGQLRSLLDAARKTEANLRANVASVADRYHAAMENLRAEKTTLEGQLRRARDEQTKLQREPAGIKREHESAQAREHIENALLRERINDIAAEVARLTSALEGEGSPIDAILAETEAPSVAAATSGDPDAKTVVTRETKGNLAERIRALKNRASRVSQPS